MLSVMGDVDGDTLLITPSQELLNLVESHNVLYYRMFKADPEEINEKTLAAALKRSYQNNSKGKSINFIANTITKVWNKDNVNESDIRTIQHFTALSNSSIDYPKTQKIIGLPEDDERVYQNMLDEKSPYYFRWVKNKKKDSVNQTNNSMVNRINNHVAKETNDLRYKYEGVQDFEYSMLQRRNVNGEVTVKRDEKYKDIYGICNIYGSRSQILTQKLKKIAEDQVKDNEEVIDGKYDLLHSMCLNDLLSVYSNKGRGKDGYQKECMADLANIMVDICYCQIQKPIDIFNTLWSCVGETLVENIVLNLGNESYARKTRSRMAYTTEKIKAVDDKKRKLQEYIDESHVDIYRSDFEVVSSINVKGAKPETVANLRKLYFVLLCLCKGSKSHRIIIKRGKKTKMNNAKLMRMIGLSNDNISTMLEKLEGFGLINIEKSKINSDKSITLKNVRFIKQTAENVIFTVKNVYSPIIYYQAFKEGKKINECVICGRDFLKVGNKKTCSDSCAKKLEAISKHENYVSKTAAEIGEFQ
jgi:DNA-binding HxlR family transcriptional regulator